MNKLRMCLRHIGVFVNPIKRGISLNVDAVTYERFKDVAKANDRTVAAELNLAMREHLMRNFQIFVDDDRSWKEHNKYLDRDNLPDYPGKP